MRIVNVMLSIGLLILAPSCAVFGQNDVNRGVDPCQSGKFDLTKSRDFVINLYCIAKQNRKDLWWNQLSNERQALGSDYLSQHFAAWSKGLIEFVEKDLGGHVDRIETEAFKPQEGERYVIRVKNPTAKPGVPAFEAFIKVILQDGRLRIDEN